MLFSSLVIVYDHSLNPLTQFANIHRSVSHVISPYNSFIPSAMLVIILSFPALVFLCQPSPIGVLLCGAGNTHAHHPRVLRQFCGRSTALTFTCLAYHCVSWDGVWWMGVVNSRWLHSSASCVTVLKSINLTNALFEETNFSVLT